MPPRSRSRHWLVTINNPPPADVFEVNMMGLEGAGKIKYAVWQLERGELNGTPHMQMWVIVPRAVRFRHPSFLFW